MVNLVLLVEGQSEEHFVKLILQPYLKKECPRLAEEIRAHNVKGGSNVAEFKRKLRNYVGQRNTLVTMMVDYSGSNIGRSESRQQGNQSSDETVKDREKEFRRQLKIEFPGQEWWLEQYFVPYFSMHEFEALLFSNANALEKFIYENGGNPSKRNLYFKGNREANPEVINHQRKPSHRLKSCLGDDYQKVDTAVALAQEIGIDIMCAKCEHFRYWVEQLVEKINAFSLANGQYEHAQ